jgi:uncharacterized membrane protein YdjX (TVP38/TMEM64 family)
VNDSSRTIERAETDERDEADGQDSRRGRRRDAAARHGTWILPVAIVATLVILYFTVPPFRDFTQRAWELLSSGDRDAFAEWIQGFGGWAPVVMLGAMLIQTLAAFIPSIIVMIVSVLAFGPIWGGLLNFGGLLLAAAMAYGIGRALGESVVDAMVGEDWEQRIEGWVERYGFWTVVAFRISPVFSSDAVSYVGGLVRMGFKRFVAATALGVAPFVVLISWLGESFERLESGLIWVSVGSAVLLVAWIVYDRKTGDH